MEKSILVRMDLRSTSAQCLGCEHAGDHRTHPPRRSRPRGDEHRGKGSPAKHRGVYGGEGLGMIDLGARSRSTPGVPDRSRSERSSPFRAADLSVSRAGPGSSRMDTRPSTFGPNVLLNVSIRFSPFQTSKIALLFSFTMQYSS
jgi:hypothetical protein